jgi:hypothetical protein
MGTAYDLNKIPVNHRRDVKKAVEILRNEGCEEIYLFGSLIEGPGTEPHPETYENKKPQITQITQIFIFFLFVFSHLPIFSTSYLPSFRAPSCNFVANFLVIFMVVPHDAAASPKDDEKKKPTNYTN